MSRPRTALLLLLPLLLMPTLAAADSQAAYRTVVVFGDTQHLVRAGASDPTPRFLRLLAMTRWVAEHRESENIDFVLHVGDVIQSGHQCYFGCDEATAQRVNAEWDRFVEAWSPIEDAGIPFAIVTGNHDNAYPRAASADSAAVDGFASFYGRERFAGDPTLVATCDAATPDDRCHGRDTVGHVWRFELGEQPVLVAGLPNQASFEAQAWFEDTLAAQAGEPVVLLSHQWLRPFELLWFRFLQVGRGGNPGPLTAQAFMTAMGHFTQDRQRVVALGDYRVLTVEFDRQTVVGTGDAAILLLRFYLEPDEVELIDGVDALRLEPDGTLVRSFPGRTPFSIDDDLDGDGWIDPLDNCPLAFNPGQANADADPSGDLCDADLDGDGHPNDVDNCPELANPDQWDANDDGAGNRCDADLDDDGDVDRRDLTILRDCRRAGGGAPKGRAALHDPTCRESDLDGSGVVDLADEAIFDARS